MLIPSSVARFYPAGDVGALADQLADLASDRSALAQSRSTARALAEARYTWDHQAATVEAVLQEVAA